MVVTGISVLSSIGNNKEEFINGLKHGKCGTKPLSERIDPCLYSIDIASLIEDDFYFKQILTENPVDFINGISISIAKDAIKDSRFFESMDFNNMGVAIATSQGANELRRIFYQEEKEGKTPNYHLLFNAPSSRIAESICNNLKINGSHATFVTACAAGTNAIGYAFNQICTSRMKSVLVGGVDLFSTLSFSGFSSLKAVSKTTCRPFDANRSGLTLGEAVAFLVLEELEHALDRNALIYGEIVGYGFSNDAYHETAPDPDGGGAIRSMKNALYNAGISASDIEYINAHGTGTIQNDIMEIKAIKSVFRENLTRLHVSSSKSQFGHTMGTAGIIEGIVCLIALNQGFIPPTINLESSICENLGIVKNHSIEKEFEYALSNSFAFGGNTASIIFKRYK
ncbi:beta-ketoacyl-[acyl-carrier-protein] synthase family protein [Heyndrickxia sp. NPDC080065]|uniref:beta-ketoacyl-[acyl-carrier-protein] synthase family protein n=1 Tax=Heyndrickxia sp. NPDC080065 TaxID=3390568 RepID=UPI003CFCB19E